MYILFWEKLRVWRKICVIFKHPLCTYCERKRVARGIAHKHFIILKTPISCIEWFYLCIFNNTLPCPTKLNHSICKYIKHSRYFHLTSNFWSIHYTMVNGCTYYVWYGRYCLYWWKNIDRLLISSGICQGKRKYFAWNLKCGILRFYVVCHYLPGYNDVKGCLKETHMRTLPNGLSDNVLTDLW